MFCNSQVNVCVCASRLVLVRKVGKSTKSSNCFYSKIEQLRWMKQIESFVGTLKKALHACQWLKLNYFGKKILKCMELCGWHMSLVDNNPLPHCGVLNKACHLNGE